MATAVITGANRGIGLHLARAYAAGGDEVVVGVRSPEAPAAHPPGVQVLPLDVADDGSVAAFAAALRGRTVDVLINNAGVIGPDRQGALDMDFAGFLRTLDVNTLGPLRVTQALLVNLRRWAAGRVAVVSSYMGSMSAPGSDHVAYRASKVAVNKAFQALAADLASEGMSVAVLHPGWVRTDMGGPSAPVEPEDSAAGLKAVLDRLTVETTGRFWNYDGDPLPW